MRKITIFGFGALILLLVLGLVQIRGVAAGDPAGQQTVDVNWHGQSGSGPVEGAWAKLVRNDNGASFTFHARELNPGHVYTIWFVIVNNPAACTAVPCSTSDIILNPTGVQSDVTYGTGHVSGASGMAAFSGQIPAGVLPGGWLGNGFTNPRNAEIHLVLNDHGPVIPALVSNMLHTYRGGCTDASLPPIFPPAAFADGIPGPNTCYLYQTAIFLAD